MLKIKQLKGKVNYLDINKRMNLQVNKVAESQKNEEIWFLEHEKVFTAGSSTPKDFNKKEISKIPVIKVNRGGKITYHSPGQLVIYPILNLKKRKLNIIDYINTIEEILISVFKAHSINLHRKKEKNRGLWIKYNNKEKKIIFIGLRYSKGVIYHGISINFNNDLQNFRKIRPCGLEGNNISRLEEIGVIYNKLKIKKDIKEKFREKFD